jgi:putative ABC transport system permease protein
VIWFLLKGLLRDRTRSVFPVLMVTAGVAITVVYYAWLKGFESSIVQSTAHFHTGYVRVMTQAYAAEADQIPNDLSLTGADTLLAELRRTFPDLLWTPRIQFGGLLDIPDERGETKAQAPVIGMGVDLLSPDSPEWGILNVRSSVVRGRVPTAHREILISDDLAARLGIQVGQVATLISATMYGSMALANFTVVGTVRFGVGPMDRGGAVIADLRDVQAALDMENGAGGLLGFFRDDLYHESRADSVTNLFNARHRSADQFAPVMGTLREQSGLSDLLDYVTLVLNGVTAFFVVAMSIVLWNAELMGSLRRYGEIGVRLALGEDKGHIYRAMLVESIAIGLVGSVLGTAVGLACAYALEVHGVNFGQFYKNGTMMVSDIVRAHVTVAASVIGFLPGLLATLLGTSVSGIGIYRRQTSQLFKELEA